MSGKKKLETRRLDSTEWLIIGIGAFLLALGLYSFFTVQHKVYEIQHGSDFQTVSAEVTYVGKERKPLDSEQMKEKERLEEQGLTYHKYDYRYKADVTYQVKGDAHKGTISSDEPIKVGTKVKVKVFQTGFGEYKILDEDSFGPTAFLSYLVCGGIGTLFGVGLILLCLVGLHIDNAPIRKKLKEKERRQREQERRQRERNSR